MSRQQRYADSLLLPLDKSQISTHILYDRVAPSAVLDVFNLVYNNPDTSGVHHFLQAYYEMHTANYNNPGTDPCRQVLADNATHYRQRDTVLIGVLRYSFNYIDSNAVRNNQLRWDTSAPSRLFDVPGRSGSPYLLREVAVAAALADSIRSATVRFRLDPASTFGNTGAALLSASIDFGDGSGNRTCTPGQVVQISYGTSGRKTLRYVLSYTDGSQFTTYSTLYVPISRTLACINCRTTASDESACRTEPLTSTISFQGIAGQSEISYYYNASKSCGNNAAQPITKPVIIVDGIDYDGTRRGENIYNKYLYYFANGQERNLGFELRNAGYDVVILDFPNVEQRISIGPFIYSVIVRHSGADYMERNAYSLVTLIQQLNQRMQAAGSTEKVVVIGPSMGGQIARYALAYMEHNNIPHNTRLFLSLDSPHNGASIPLGLQHFVDYFAGISNDQAIAAGLAELDSPAARELTQHHHSQGTAFRPDPARTQFLNDLSSLGNYPSQLRRVAVTNGALDGAPQRDQNSQPIQAGQQAFGLEQRGVPSGGFGGTFVRIFYPLGLLARTITLASARVYYEPGFGQTQKVLESYYFWKGRHTQEATGPSGSCGLDGAPGGFRYFFSFAQSSVAGLFQYKHFYSVRDKACFIPTLSGLGYTQPADNCQAVGQDLVCAATTPFDAYYGPTGHNEEHIQLTPGNVEFIRNEILLKTPVPAFLVAPQKICPNSAAVAFSVRAECLSSNRPGQAQPATTYTWTLGAGLQLVSGQGTASVQIQPAPGYLGSSSIQVVATRAGYAASAPVSQAIRIGGPDTPQAVQTDTPGICLSNVAHFAITNFDPSASYTISQVTGARALPARPTFNEFLIKAGGNAPRTGSFTITATACGMSESAEYYYDFGPCDGARQYSIAPNPAADEVQVQEEPAASDQARSSSAKASTADDNDENVAKSPGIELVRIYDNHGQLRLEQNFKGTPNARLSVSQLLAGLYVMHILSEGTVVSRQQFQVVR